eukprot:189669_1
MSLENASQKKKKLSKAERIALRQQQQSKANPTIHHPDDAIFGELIFNQSQYKTNRKWTELHQLSQELHGKDVLIRGRADTVRTKGGRVFLLIRRSFCKIQVVAETNPVTPKPLVTFCARIKPESIVDVCGSVQITSHTIKSATPSKLQSIEIIVKKIYVVAGVEENRLPFQINDASRPHQSNEEKQFAHVGQKKRLDNRWIDLRTIANHAIFRIQAGVGKFFRDYLTNEGFIEIHSPKLISAASEGGADVFKLKYFGKDAFLAQSPQLYKQMAICSDLFKVFEVGPVFRAENCNTHRHLCEFTGLDLEMEFKEHYHEVLSVIGNMFVYIFKNINKHYKAELEAVNAQYPFEPLPFDDKLLILTFKEAKQMTNEYYQQLLKEGKTKEAKTLLMGESKDFSTPEEKLLGRLVLKKYGTSFYCVDKYPVTARPFYTMADPYNPLVSNSYDFFLRGEEITSGAQRIHNTEVLVKQARKHKIPIRTIQSYINSFKYATSPHAGCGIGLERVVMLFLGLNNVRKASLFPRDPSRCQP